MEKDFLIQIPARAADWLAGMLMVGTAMTVRKSREKSKEKARVLEVLDIVGGDTRAGTLIATVLNAASGYVSACFNAETQVSMARARGAEGAELREITERMDGLRRRAHESLIAGLRACNRYLFQNYKDELPTGGVYTSDPWHLSAQSLNRLAIGDWAGRLVLGFFKDRSN